MPSIGGFHFESINRTGSRHDGINDVHEHTAGKQEGTEAQPRHGSYQDNFHAGKFTSFVGAEKVIDAKE